MTFDKCVFSFVFVGGAFFQCVDYINNVNCEYMNI